MFELGATIANVIALALEVPGAFALATLVFEMWTIFAPVEVSTAETWRRRIIPRRQFGQLALLRWMFAALTTFLRWLLYCVEIDVVGENSAALLCSEEVHEVGNNVEMLFITIFVKLLRIRARRGSSAGHFNAESRMSASNCCLVSSSNVNLFIDALH